MDELKIITDFLARLFTPQQQAALLIMSLCVLVVTHNFKIIWFGLHAERRQLKTKFDIERRTAKKVAIIRLFALITGTLFGVIGHYITDIKEPLWFWLVSGLLSSGGAFLIVGLYNKWIKRK